MESAIVRRDNDQDVHGTDSLNLINNTHVLSDARRINNMDECGFGYRCETGGCE